MRSVGAFVSQRVFATFWGKLVALAAAVFVLMLVSALVLVGVVRMPLAPALWWAFLHLIDPSRLAADQGAVRRVLGVVLTVAGLVIVFGTVLAILTEAFDRSLRRLGRIDVAVRARGHLVIVGWHPAIVRLVAAYRLLVSRFGRFYGLATRIVLVATDADRDDRDDIVRVLRQAGRGMRVDVVFGDPGDDARLERASVATARDVVVWPAPAFARHPRELDVASLRSTLEVEKVIARGLVAEDPNAGEPPRVRAALVWGENADAADMAIGAGSDLLVADRVLAALETRFLVDPPWATAIGELFEADGQRVLLSNPFGTRIPDGTTFGDLARFLDSVPIGLVRQGDDGARRVRIAPPASMPLERTDRFVFVDSFESAARGTHRTGGAFVPVRTMSAPVVLEVREPAESSALRVLALGWDHHVVTLLEEMASYPAEMFSLVSVSALPEGLRAADVRTAARAVPVTFRTQSLADFAALCAVIDAEQPDAVLIAADWRQVGDVPPEFAEASAVLHSLMAERALAGRSVPLLVSPRRSADADLLRGRRATLVLPTVNEILRRLILQSVLHPGLGAVLDAIFDPDVVRGRTVAFEPADAGAHSFAAVWEALLGHATVPLGIVRADHSLRLHPSFDEMVLPGDRLLVLRWASGQAWEAMPG